MNAINSTNNMMLQELNSPPTGNNFQHPPPREKNKRPQLSCNPCRARKVKCDRISPCSACSLHQIADMCQYDLSETDRRPILQAEALKEKNKVIASLRNEIALLRGDATNFELDDNALASQQKIRLPPRSPKGSQQKSRHSQGDDYPFSGESSIIGVADDFHHLSFDRRPTSLGRQTAQGGHPFDYQVASTYPFPCIWSAKDETTALITLLPPEHDLFFHLEAFQRRSLSFSFPVLPEEVTMPEVERFLEDIEQNAALHPDFLALLFTTLALGLQDGIHDKFDGNWTTGAIEAERKKGDVYIAAAMQSLRFGAFLSHPTMTSVQALAMMAPYLTNGGKFLDAAALFGVTVRLAQSIGLHRDPSQLSSSVSSKEQEARKALWWWLLHLDVQYSIALGRPLAISNVGACPTPGAPLPGAIWQSVSDHIVGFVHLGRQVVATPYPSNEKIDSYTDEVLLMQKSLPLSMQFDTAWLKSDRPLAGWPLDVQAAILHAEAHNLILYLNRRRVENGRRHSEDSHLEILQVPQETDVTGIIRGRPRVLNSCRSLLNAFEFFRTRLQAGMICWTMGQMAFNASMLLTLSMLETGETQDLLPVQHAYGTFLEMNRLGIHKLAGTAVERLGKLMKEFRTEDSANENVMGHGGMMLLEDPSSHKIFNEAFPREGPAAEDDQGASQDARSTTQRSKSSSQKKRQRRPTTTRDAGIPKSRRDSLSKTTRALQDRRFSDSSTPRPSQRRRVNKEPLNLSFLTSLADDRIFAPVSASEVKSESLFTPTNSHFDSVLSQPPYASPDQGSQQVQQALDGISRPQSQGFGPVHTQQQSQQQQTQQQQQHHHHHHHQNLSHSTAFHHPNQQLTASSQPPSQPDQQPFEFNTPSAAFPPDYFETNLQSAVGVPAFDDHSLGFEHSPFTAPPFSMPGDQVAFGAAGF